MIKDSGNSAIDAHAHMMPPCWTSGPGTPTVAHHREGDASILIDGSVFRRVPAETFDVERRVEALERRGLSRQIISPIPIMFCAGVPSDIALDLHRQHNDFIAAAVSIYPDRLIGLGTVPIQSVGASLPELERIKSLGLRGIEIGTHVEGRSLDECGIETILSAAASLDLAVFLHPQGPTLGQERMNDFYLPFVVGYPSDTCLALTRLILSGILSRIPDLRLGAAHAGGTLVATLGRIAHAIRVRPETGRHLSEPLESILRRLYVDTITHDPAMLRLTIERLGSQRVMLGSDCPFDMGVENPLDQLLPLNLSDEVRDDILWRTALNFLGLSSTSSSERGDRR